MNPETVTLTRNGDGGWSLVVSPVRDEPTIEAPRFARPVAQNEAFVAVPAADTSGNKYELVPEGGMNRIRALRAFQHRRSGRRIAPGDLGGLISHRSTLAQEGTCWIGRGASVNGRMRIAEDAYLGDNVRVDGNGMIGGRVVLGDDAKLSGTMNVQGDATINGSAILEGEYNISGDAVIMEDARISGRTQVSGTTWVFGEANLAGVSVNAGRFSQQMRVRSADDFFVVQSRWGALLTARAATEEGFQIVVGCQTPRTLEELRETLSDNGGTAFELELFSGFEVMVRAALKAWGVTVEV